MGRNDKMIETVVKETCPDCHSSREIRKGDCVEPDGKVLVVYRCKDCGFMWDKKEYFGGDKQ